MPRRCTCVVTPVFYVVPASRGCYPSDTFAMPPVPRFRRLVAALAIVIVLAGVSAVAAAQRGFFRSRPRELDIRNTPYDGRFTFVRVNYDDGARRLLVPRSAVVGRTAIRSPSRT